MSKLSQSGTEATSSSKLTISRFFPTCPHESSSIRRLASWQSQTKRKKPIWEPPSSRTQLKSFCRQNSWAVGNPSQDSICGDLDSRKSSRLTRRENLNSSEKSL